MLKQLKRLGTETAVYGISTILGRFLNFLLVPFYTNVLAPGEYGTIAYVYSLIAFVNVLYSYGMESAYFKYSSTLEIGTAEQNFTTPFLSLSGTSIFFSALIMILASPIAEMIYLSPDLGSVLFYTAGILMFDTVAIIPFAALRMERRAKLFAAIKSLNIVVNVGMNLLLLLVFKMGITGVFISGMTASALTLVILLPVIFRRFKSGFNTPLWKALLKFGLPYVPAGFAAMAIQVIDRPILRALTNDAAVGIYQANYRLGIFMMLVVSMYDYAWRPFYFSTAKEDNAKEIFARVLTYFTLVMSAVFLALTFFIADIIKIRIFGKFLIHPDYWSGLGIVPIILLGYLFLGVSTNLSAGIYIEKKTKYIPVVTGIGAAVNIIANFLLIPWSGITGAAWATFLAYFSMAVAMFFFAQRIYRVNYELDRIFKIAVSAAAVTAVYYTLSYTRFYDAGPAALFWKLFLIGLFLLIMYILKFFKKEEISFIRRIFGSLQP